MSAKSTDVSAETLLIPVLDIAPYEAAASLFAVLAYPTNKKARTRFDRAIRFKAVEHFCRDPEWANSHQSLRPSDLLQDRRTVEREYERGIKLIRTERMIAAKMAAPTDCAIVAIGNGFGAKGSGGRKALEYGYLAPHDLGWLAEISVDLDRLRGRESQLNKHNITHRHWVPSKPVLHLCLAIQMMVNEGREMDYVDIAIDEYFNDSWWIINVIQLAESYRRIIPIEHKKISQRDMIEVTWR